MISDDERVQPIVSQANAGILTPIEFCRKLHEAGIKGQAARMQYVRDCFGLNWAKAKEVVIQCDYGSMDELERIIHRGEK